MDYLIGNGASMKPQSLNSWGRPVAFAGWLVLVWVAAAPAAAQSLPPGGGIAPPGRSERPYRGLFGSGVGNTAQSLTFEGNLGGGFVEDPLAEQGSTAGAESGGSGVGGATVTYSMSRSRFGVNASTLSHIDYYPTLPAHQILPRQIASGAVYYLPFQPTRVTLSLNWKNLPEFSFSDLFDTESGEGVPFTQDVGMTVQRYTRYGSALDISHKLSARTRVEAGVSYARGMIGPSEWTIMTATGGITHNIAKGLAAYVEYRDGGQRDESAGSPPRTPASHQRRNRFQSTAFILPSDHGVLFDWTRRHSRSNSQRDEL